MFWRFGGYVDDSTTDTLLDKPAAPSRWNGTGKRNERRPGVPSSIKGGPVGGSKGSIQFGSITDSPPGLQSKRGRSKRSTSNSPLRATNVMAGNDGGNAAIPLQELGALRTAGSISRFKPAEEELLEQTPWANPQHPIHAHPIQRSNTLWVPRLKSPTTFQDSTELPPENIKRICVSYTISEDMSGDRGNKILSRISEKKRDSCEVRLRVRGSYGDRWSPKHPPEAVEDANGALNGRGVHPDRLKAFGNESPARQLTPSQINNNRSRPHVPSVMKTGPPSGPKGLQQSSSQPSMRLKESPYFEQPTYRELAFGQAPSHNASPPTSNPSRFDKSSLKYGEEEDFPGIPGEVQRNPDMAPRPLTQVPKTAIDSLTGPRDAGSGMGMMDVPANLDWVSIADLLEFIIMLISV
jgi:hypothetical protein